MTNQYMCAAYTRRANGTRLCSGAAKGRHLLPAVSADGGNACGGAVLHNQYCWAGQNLEAGFPGEPQVPPGPRAPALIHIDGWEARGRPAQKKAESCIFVMPRPCCILVSQLEESTWIDCWIGICQANVYVCVRIRVRAIDAQTRSTRTGGLSCAERGVALRLSVQSHKTESVRAWLVPALCDCF